MFDRLYSQMTRLVDYKILLVIPPILTVLLVGYTLHNGVQFGMDFKGGTWMDIITDTPVDESLVNSLKQDLVLIGLEEPKVYTGQDIDSGKNKVSIATASVVNESLMLGVVTKYIYDLLDSDVATVSMDQEPPGWLEFKLSSRFKDLKLNYSNGVLTIRALNLDENELESLLKDNLNQDYNATVRKKNFNLREVRPTLGEYFREQGIKAIFISFILMAIVVFWAFKTFIPSIAVLEAGICDVLVAIAGMSIFNIPFDSASLGALLMLIGYSVDTDVLLTFRLLRERSVDVDEGINQAMKTGLMMTATMIGAMAVTIVVTTFVIQIQTLQSIATVLMFGLIADIFTTWWTNAGLLKWYLAKPKTTSKKRFKFSIFKE